MKTQNEAERSFWAVAVCCGRCFGNAVQFRPRSVPAQPTGEEGSFLLASIVHERAHRLRRRHCADFVLEFAGPYISDPNLKTALALSRTSISDLDSTGPARHGMVRTGAARFEHFVDNLLSVSG